MKVAIVGSRDLGELFLRRIADYVQSLPFDSIIVTGGAHGADEAAEYWGKARGMSVEVYLPDWEKHGKSAGMIRNAEIITNANVVVAFWDGKSKGTKNTIDRALQAPHILEVIVFKEAQK